MDQAHREELQMREDQQLTASAQSAAMQQAARQQEQTLQNGYFLNELRDSDIDSELYGWLEEEYPTLFSGAHSVTNRSDTWDQEADLLMHNKRERLVAERSPGRLLKDRPRLLAIAQGVSSPQDPKFREPLTPRKQRAIFGGAEIAADLMALSKNRAGLDATTTATTENRVKRESAEESTKEKLSERLYG
jgi:hypothetical protein